MSSPCWYSVSDLLTRILFLPLVLTLAWGCQHPDCAPPDPEPLPPAPAFIVKGWTGLGECLVLEDSPFYPALGSPEEIEAAVSDYAKKYGYRFGHQQLVLTDPMGNRKVLGYKALMCRPSNQKRTPLHPSGV